MIRDTIRTWLNALFKPSIKTYEQIYGSEAASLRLALLWIICCAFLSGILSKIGALLLPYHPLRQLSTPTARGTLSAAQASRVAESVQWIANPWLLVFLAPVVFLLMIFMTHLVAQRIGGRADLGRYSYTIAAIQSPLGIITTLIIWLPLVGQRFSTLLSLGFYIFAIVATKAAYKLSTRKAIAAV